MARVSYVHNETLNQPFADAAPIYIGTPGWFAWLDLNASFAYANSDGHFTARKQRVHRNDNYWMAYRKRGGRLHSTYLGRSQDLTLERLKMAARALASKTDLFAPGSPPQLSDDRHSELLSRTVCNVPLLPTQRVPRPRLFSLLRDDRQPLVLLVAPSGYGKTVLVADWIAEDQRKAAWVSLEASDNDPTRFWSAVAAALDSVWRGVGRRTLALLRSSYPLSLAAILPTLLKDIATHVVADGHGYPALLVLDDYHVITDNAIHDSMSHFVERLPSQLRLAILERAEPPLPLSDLRRSARLAELRLSDLSFTQDETAHYLRDLMGLSRLGKADVVALAERTDGCIAALQCGAFLLQDDKDPSSFIFSLGGETQLVFSRLIEEALSRQPEHLQRFLLATAPFNQVCAELCDELAGAHGFVFENQKIAAESLPQQSRAQDALAQLGKTGLFLIANNDEGRWYRRSPLLTEVVLRQLRASNSDLELRLRCTASLWFEREGFAVEAIDQALAGQDWERVAEMMEREVHSFWQRGESATVRRWLSALPETILKSRPQLALMHAMSMLEAFRLRETSILLDDVERALSVEEEHKQRDVTPLQPRTTGIRARVNVLRAHTAMLSLDSHGGAELRLRGVVRQALDDLPQNDYIWRAAGRAMLGESLFRGDDLDQAEQAFADGASAAQSGHAYGLALASMGMRIETLIGCGRLTEAQILGEDASRLAVEWGLDSLPAHGDVALAMIHYERNELARAERVILHEIGDIEHIGLSGLRFRCLLILCRLRLARGDVESALQALNHLEASFGGQATAHIQALSAWRARIHAAHATSPGRAQNQLDRAAVLLWAEEATDLVNPADDSVAHIASRPILTMLVRAHLLNGNAQAALSLLQILGPRAKSVGANDVLIELLSLEAITLDRLGMRNAALDALRQALSLGEPEGYVRSFVDEGLPMVRLLEHFSARRDRRFAKLTDYARRLLVAFGQSKMAHAPTSTLTPRELEALRLLATGLSTHKTAAQLCISVNTLNRHLTQIFGKLNVRDRTRALIQARKFGLLD